jgi:hypothetical protein
LVNDPVMSMALSEKRQADYYQTVRAIVASKYVGGYVIGLSQRPRRRFKQYELDGYRHFVILADRLTRDEAVELEKYLFERCTRIRSKPTWRKYHQRRREEAYRPSSNTRTPKEKVHSVYMAWKEPESRPA